MAAGSMKVDLQVGETLRMQGVGGQPIFVTLLKKSGQLARLEVSAPKDVKIERPNVSKSR